ncbi:hypothetical protein [Dichotomicrobium thermohalophilum]|uniref:Uncharacterized protein n=1 Tax=Dichotomicrobium thermohalophilum TaxID=933063 RepID=A0A397QB48_9HYPH|nr:hypothetical protein [Dichotomicrobium thermohalophilum]RIA55334.1 hypothetical protein BXY53_0395 [Dichotomicrobium thermohalophilum]
MGTFSASLKFILTIVLGAFAFAATAIQQPTLMREFLSIARRVPEHFAASGLSDEYLVWVDILLGGDKLVFIGYLIAARIVVGLLAGLLGSIFGFGMRRRPVREPSPFAGWD